MFRIADRVTVFRGKRNVGHCVVAGTDMGQLVATIVGPGHAPSAAQDIGPASTPVADPRQGPLALRLNEVGNDRLHGVDLDLRHGKIHGLAGFVESGRTGIPETIFGIRPAKAGTIAVDGTATAATCRKVSQTWIKLVFMDNVPPGMKHPEQYAAMVSADSRGNAYIAARVLASCIPQGGTVGLVNLGADHFSTNQRTKGVKDRLAKNRPDIKIRQTDFTDPAKVAQTPQRTTMATTDSAASGRGA